MRIRITWLLGLLVLAQAPCLFAQDKAASSVIRSAYEYESKPEDEAFAIFNPAKAPAPGPLMLKTGDRLAIIGDSITEQKMYSRIIENYLTACVPDLKVTVRQYGWSGEKTDGFLRRMDRDCLTFQPTIATLCYGMNDARYRPFDVTNGQWYRDHYTAIVRKFKENGVRVVVGSPGCSGKIAAWVKGKSGTLEEHNLNLCALRDIALGVARDEQVAFADIFWPMYQQRILAPRRFNKTDEEYAVAGKDGIHPGWAGQAIMAYAFLNALGLDGNLGTIDVDLTAGKATISGNHELKGVSNGEVKLVSTQYPYCATGALDDDNSLRSGFSLVPFAEKLNRFTLKIRGTNNKPVKVTWGMASKTFTPDEVANNINLAAAFETNPFSEQFARLDAPSLPSRLMRPSKLRRSSTGRKAKRTSKKLSPIPKPRASRWPKPLQPR